MPTVDVLLHGDGLRLDVASVGLCSTLLITGEHLAIVDTGHAGRRVPLEAALARRGIAPGDIDIAIMTHSHWDHAQNFDMFPNAQLLINEWEYAYTRNPHPNDWATPRWTGVMIDSQPRVVPVKDGHQIEIGVRLMHTPGHSAGTQAVIVDTLEGPVAITGDGIQNAGVALSKQNQIIFWSEDDARRSIEKILAESEIIYPGHDRPFRLLKNGTMEYLAHKQMTLFGIDFDEQQVIVDHSPRLPYVMPLIEEQSDRISDK